jgi:hypothetical protein
MLVGANLLIEKIWQVNNWSSNLGASLLASHQNKLPRVLLLTKFIRDLLKATIDWNSEPSELVATGNRGASDVYAGVGASFRISTHRDRFTLRSHRKYVPS